MPDPLLNYEEVRGELKGKSHLLLGNGFSINCDERFSYSSLWEEVKKKGLSAQLIKIFKRFGTTNFEKIMKSLEDADWIAKQYKIIPEVPNSKISHDLDLLKKAFIETISQIHPVSQTAIEDVRKKACQKFLDDYHYIFTTNYDLLLYWAEVSKKPIHKSDGFCGEDYSFDEEFFKNYPEKPAYFFLHGALHLFEDEKGEASKHIWENEKNLIAKIHSEIEEKRNFPLIVTEGKSKKKEKRIRSNHYLDYCLEKLRKIEGALTIFGFSFGENDQHVIDAIAQNKKLKILYIGLYGGEPSDERSIKAQAEKINKQNKELEIKYFDSMTAKAWGPDLKNGLENCILV